MIRYPQGSVLGVLELEAACDGSRSEFNDLFGVYSS